MLRGQISAAQAAGAGKLAVEGPDQTLERFAAFAWPAPQALPAAS
jgi:hypothetical protein